MKIFSWRFVLVVATAVSLIGYPKPATATTFNVTVGPNGNLVFDPASVTIHPGDQVKWTWDSGGHSTTSGSPGLPNGIWDSGIHNAGATFTRTFNSTGTFPYYCTPHGGCCNMVGTVTVVNASPTPSPTPMPTATPSATPTPASILGNISTRSFVQTADNVMIGGFIVQGTQPKRVIIRAIGPELGQFGVPDPLQDPILELHDGTGALIGTNDNWQTTIIGGIITHDQVKEIQDSGYAPCDGRESAIIADLPAGNYTAIVRGVNSTIGVALVEVYDLSPQTNLIHNTNSILGNISTRSFVQTGDNVMIGGFIVQGTQPKRVIIRAIGPELGQFGVPDPLQDPTLELHDGTGALIGRNDNWQNTIIGGIITQDQVQDIQNSGHAPGDPSESAIIANLPAGNYTAIVRGLNNTTGVALVEVYDLSPDVDSILGNISTRSFVQTGDNVMSGGFIVQGTTPKNVIIRAIGPELSQYGVPNPLANPTLELHDGNGALIASNDNWQTTIIGGIITQDQVQDIQNSGRAPGDPSESAIIANLPPGNYTAIVRGVNNTTGVALVEAYDLH